MMLQQGATGCASDTLTQGNQPLTDAPLALPPSEPAGYSQVDSFTYLVASGLCIAAIACLSSQKTARVGNILGLIGVTTGVVTTLGALGADTEVYAQILGE